MFEVNQEVVCLEDAFSHWKSVGFNVPVKNEIYTVREILLFNRPHYTGYAIRLKEIHNPLHEFADGTEEVSFRAQYFAPLTITSEDLENILNEPVMIGLERKEYVKL